MIIWRPRGARESRKPDNSGTVAVGELVEPGRERAELLETGRASFDYVAVAVDDLVEGGWSAAEGPGSSAVGRLVAALGDRGDDAPAPQQAAINDRSARDRTRTRGPPRTGSAGRWSVAPGGRTACRSGSSSRGLRGRPRRRPHRLFADRGYDYDKYHRITPRIARRSVAHGSGLGKTRWVVERAFAWLHQFKRLRIRYEMRADLHQGPLQLACIIICLRRLRYSF
jgi:transposase